MKKVYVVGIGMTNFVKPGSGVDFPELGKEAVEKALADAQINYSQIEQAICGYVYGDTASGQRILYQLGMTGIPIHNVNNSGSTGASALFLGKQLVEGGVCNVILVFGFEKMSRGPLNKTLFEDRAHPIDKHLIKMAEITQLTSDPLTAQLFGNAAIEHMKKYGTTKTQFAKIAAKNHLHSVKNPQAQSRKTYDVEEVLSSRQVYGPLTLLQCCPTTDGASAAVLMSEQAVIAHGLQSKAVEILGMEMATDTPAVFTENSLIKLAGYDMTALAAKKVYKKTNVSPEDINIVELHDCFSSNELITYEALLLCGEGEGGKFADAGENTYGGKVVVNPSGGCIGKGHPLGASGIAQTAEIVWQLRGEAGERQVPNPKIALQHALGIGGSAVVGLYRKGFQTAGSKPIVNLTKIQEKFKVYTFIRLLEVALKKFNDKQIKHAEGIYGLNVKNGPYRSEGYWCIDVKNRKISCNRKETTNMTITVCDDDFEDVISSKLDLKVAQERGKINIEGDVRYAMGLITLFRQALDSESRRSKL